ncbi:unnamed protein product [Brachionus calyciflorus]|uniref:Tetraspanin n=1 Tax=Brachionus calyciflorus TaxID=104777 RepID=A0A813NXD6_9BILA|nr:unnamed protein product [Brachionus calyciflorus]
MAKIQLSNLPTNKIIFSLFNILLILISCSYIGIGSWLIDIIYQKPEINVIKDNYNKMGGLMLAAGLTGFFLALYGFAITVCRNIYSVFAYITVIVILFLFGIAVGIIGLVYADMTENMAKESLTTNLFSSNEAKDKTLTNNIQQTYKCCGLDQPNDWMTVLKQSKLPNSCCSTNSGVCNQTDYFLEGCISVVSKSVRMDMAISGGISLAISLILILGIALSVHSLIEVFEKKKEIAYHKTDLN